MTNRMHRRLVKVAVILRRLSISSLRVIRASRRPRDLRNLRLVPVGFEGGWYHNVPVGRSTAWEVFGRSKKSPLMDPRGHHELWLELEEILSTHSTAGGRSPLVGRRVMDIGPAEGLFTLLALSAGAARVEIVQPGGNRLSARLERVVTVTGNRDRVGIGVGYFPLVGMEVVPQSDVILVQGVVYHATDCEVFVEPLLAAKKPICWEFMYALTEPREFDPRTHDDSRGGLFSRRWLEERVTMAGHAIYQCDRYNARCRQPGYLAPAADFQGWSRAAFVSLPPRA